MKALEPEDLNPRCFGAQGFIGKKAEVQKPNRVPAKCAIEQWPTAAATTRTACGCDGPFDISDIQTPKCRVSSFTGDAWSTNILKECTRMLHARCAS
jgi:hypothetical protein